MAIQARVLAEAGRDNAAFVRVDSGQALTRLLLDCGEGCLDALSTGEVQAVEVQAVDHLFFSHLHVDHVAGFDSFFRRTSDRTTLPNHIWGPPGTATGGLVPATTGLPCWRFGSSSTQWRGVDAATS